MYTHVYMGGSWGWRTVWERIRVFKIHAHFQLLTTVSLGCLPYCNFQLFVSYQCLTSQNLFSRWANRASHQWGWGIWRAVYSWPFYLSLCLSHKAGCYVLRFGCDFGVLSIVSWPSYYVRVAGIFCLSICRPCGSGIVCVGIPLGTIKCNHHNGFGKWPAQPSGHLGWRGDWAHKIQGHQIKYLIFSSFIAFIVFDDYDGNEKICSDIRGFIELEGGWAIGLLLGSKPNRTQTLISDIVFVRWHCLALYELEYMFWRRKK